MSITSDADIDVQEFWGFDGRDDILCVYDPTSVYSTLNNIEVARYLRKMKKNVVSQKFYEVQNFDDYDAVLLMMDSLADIPATQLSSFSGYVHRGELLLFVVVRNRVWTLWHMQGWLALQSSLLRLRE
ncbi:MAG: hypothetical protein IJX10_02115 [Phascolarctobacterium sp.]|nr:hypothetical protein [Phascolarctobacterium sp.]